MTRPAAIRFVPADPDTLSDAGGRLAVLVPPDGKLGRLARRVNRLTRGALGRLAGSEAFGKLPEGGVAELAWPGGLAAEAIYAVKLPKRCAPLVARRAGAKLAARAGVGKGGSADLLVLAGVHPQAADLAFGVGLRGYDFAEHKTAEAKPVGAIAVAVAKPDELAPMSAEIQALAEGVFFTRDLTSAPSNVLTTSEFATRLLGLADLGVEVEVLEEDELSRLGMGMLLAVGQGSASPSKVVVMRWQGGGEAAPLALIGKGVVFDTGGISIKPAQGMEEMTADMGGAGVVAGVMRALALRKARANVVGLVGLVENMPDGTAMRPGDVVTSMKGDTVEVINTDAEGRLVLGDVMWYAQDRFAPTAMIDLATLTGAVIVGLGNEMAGVFANDDALADAFLAAAKAEGEGAWRLPMGEAYDEMLKSDIADMKNVGGRAAGAITAAQFLRRFVKDGTTWMHLDIAGVARTPAATAFAPKGASGWGVLSLDRLIRDRFEG